MPITVVSLTVILSTLGVLCKAQKTIQESLVVASDGKELNLSCSHPSAATNENIVWYRQFPNQGPRFLVSKYKGIEPMEDPKGTLIIAEDRKSSTLSIQRATLGDSALYFCVVADTVLRSGAPTVQEAFLHCPI